MGPLPHPAFSPEFTHKGGRVSDSFHVPPMANDSVGSVPTVSLEPEAGKGDAVVGPPPAESTVLSGRRLAVVFVAM